MIGTVKMANHRKPWFRGSLKELWATGVIEWIEGFFTWQKK